MWSFKINTTMLVFVHCFIVTFTLCVCIIPTESSLGIQWHFNKNSPRIKRSANLKLIDEPECSKLHLHCNDLPTGADDLYVLECVQTLKSEQIDSLNKECQHAIWTHTKELMDDTNIHEISRHVCAKDIDKNLKCAVTKKSGNLLACMLDNRDSIVNIDCQNLLQRLEWVAFSDFRLFAPFLTHCENDVAVHECGRVNSNKQSKLPQQDTIACLQSHIETLKSTCKREILHLSEWQGDNVKLDRQLDLACATDYIRFCPDLRPGSGLVYKCLMIHRMENSMTKKCQEQLMRRDKLIAQDYRVSRGLVKACKEDIKAYHCRRGVSDNKDIRLAQILLCLEGAIKNSSKVSAECQAEMVDHRKLLLQDYRLSPEIIDGCLLDIPKFCNNLDVAGRTIHCLMEHARPKKNKDRRISETCQRALESLVKMTDAGEDWRVDPVLREACKPVVDVACKDTRGGDARVISCLMEKLGTDHMTEGCETALVQIQYFVARDFKLDPQLYRACKDDAVNKCHAKKTWSDVDADQMDPERGPLVLPCLYRYAYHTDKAMQLKSVCLQEIKRVMRQRAISVDLQPEIEDVCLDDLAMYCFEKINKGEEMQCLQNNLDSLMENCKIAISNFTQYEADHVELNPVIMSVCHGVMEKHCDAVLKTGKDEGEMMECLIAHKNEPDVRAQMKCRAAIEHFQLISQKNYHFTSKFRDACKNHVGRHCPTSKTKYDVIVCLSEVVRNETIKGNRHTIPKECRQQIRAQLYQQRENIDYDPKLKEACKTDIVELCGKVEHRSAQVLECLQTHQKQLSISCHHALFPVKQQQLIDSSVDYMLLSVCQNMIQHYCHDVDPSQLLECLKNNRNEVTFEDKCRLVVTHRMIEQNTDYRFNPVLQTACMPDINKFCNKILKEQKQDEELNGKVVECLKGRFRESKLTHKCQEQMIVILKEQALNYKLNPLLNSMCKAEIETICKSENEQESTGEVEECLKTAFLNHKLVARECQMEVAVLIEEAQADIHVDPLLQRACTIDLLKYCRDLTPGAGRQLRCLQAILTSDSMALEDECQIKLTKRMEMFKNAAGVAPNDVSELVSQVYASPARRYFMLITLASVGLIFIFGLFIGRGTRRAMITKNK